MRLELSPALFTQRANPAGAVGGRGVQTSPESAHEPSVLPVQVYIADPQVTSLGITTSFGTHSSIGIMGPTVAEQAPPSHSTFAMASFVAHPPSQALGGSKGTPASPASIGHIGDALTVTVSGSMHTPVDGSQEHDGHLNAWSGAEYQGQLVTCAIDGHRLSRSGKAVVNPNQPMNGCGDQSVPSGGSGAQTPSQSPASGVT
jgi:hypothetical protein